MDCGGKFKDLANNSLKVLFLLPYFSEK